MYPRLLALALSGQYSPAGASNSNPQKKASTSRHFSTSYFVYLCIHINVACPSISRWLSPTFLAQFPHFDPPPAAIGMVMPWPWSSAAWSWSPVTTTPSCWCRTWTGWWQPSSRQAVEGGVVGDGWKICKKHMAGPLGIQGFLLLMMMFFFFFS